MWAGLKIAAVCYILSCCYCLFFQLAVEIDSILNREGGMDAEVQANIQQLAQKLYENVSAIVL